MYFFDKRITSPGVNDGYTITALSGILLWIMVASEFDLVHSFEAYESPRTFRRRSIDEIFSNHSHADAVDTPTLDPANCGDPEANADELYNKMKDSEGDETVVAILSNCTRAQRQRIRLAYEKKYKEENLLKKLAEKYNKPIDPSLYWLTYSLMVPLPSFFANEFRRALQRYDYLAITTLLTVLDESELTDMLNTYHSLYGKEGKALLEEVLNFVTTKYREFMHSQLYRFRSKNNTVDPVAACDDAETILKDLRTRLKNYDNFHTILTTRSFPQLREIVKCFERYTGEPLDKAIENVNLFWWYEEDAYVGIVRYAENKHKYFARKLKDAVEGPGTTEDTLIFIISWRADIDLGNIKKAYEDLDEKSSSLYDDVEDDTSGIFKDLLLALIGC